MLGFHWRCLTVLAAAVCGGSLSGQARAEPPARALGADLVDAREIVAEVLSAEEGESVERGSVVLLVEPDGPVDRAGLRAADAIVEVGGARVDGPLDLLRVLGQRPIGARVPLVFVRGGQVLTTSLDVEGPRYGPAPQAWLGAPAPPLR